MVILYVNVISLAAQPFLKLLIWYVSYCCISDDCLHNIWDKLIQKAEHSHNIYGVRYFETAVVTIDGFETIIPCSWADREFFLLMHYVLYPLSTLSVVHPTSSF